MKKEQFQVVIVRWLDAYLAMDVTEDQAKALADGCMQETYGYPVWETETAVAIAHERNLTDGGYRHVTVISKKYIKDIFRFTCKVKDVLKKDNRTESSPSGEQLLP